jgi:hypothetical protein
MADPGKSLRATAALANVLVLGVLVLAAALHELDSDAYYRAVQEDEALEWATFWLLVIAGLAFGRHAWLARAQGLRGVWLPAGIALFCLGVAGEEISWGQRLIGFRPPTYFLEHNFQQELNVHNIAKKWLRQLVMLGAVLGYGVALPLVGTIPRFAAWLARIGITAPPLWLAPSFLAMGIAYLVYPWSFTGEWVEQMLAAGLLFVALTLPGGGVTSSPRPALRLALTWGVALLLGVVTARAWWSLRDGLPETLQAAQVELEALRRDFESPRTRTSCATHKRVYSFVRKYDHDHMREGAFAALQSGGLPEDRAEFFLDPWNSPYWVRHICSKDRRKRAIYVYSFGPNRLRDSLPWEIRPDDLGAWVSRPDDDPEAP